jgi:hypothetical protein
VDPATENNSFPRPQPGKSCASKRMNSSQFRAGTARAYALGMKRTILSVVAVAVVTFTVVGCTGADYEEPGTSADDSDLPSDVGASEDAL